MSEFNSFTQQVGDTLPVLESMGYEVVTFKVTWGLPPKARLRLRSKGETDINRSTRSRRRPTVGHWPMRSSPAQQLRNEFKPI
jgi:hypothetical protein